MEISSQSVEMHYCFSCLANSEDYKLQDFNIQHTQFWQIFEVGTIKLCYVCRRIAQHAELFIHNVQSNQILLQNCVGNISTKLQVEEAQTHLTYPVTLACSLLDSINLPENTNTIHKNVNRKRMGIEFKSVLSKREKVEMDVHRNVVKLEITEEQENSEGEFCSAFEFDDDLKSLIKTENFPSKLDKIVKSKSVCRVTGVQKNKDGKAIVRLGKTKKKLAKTSKPVENTRKSKMPTKSAIELENKQYAIKKINISEAEYMEERDQQVVDQSYLNCSYKCDTCIKGFNYKAAYDTHMKRHTDEMGLHECCYCKVRMKTEEKMLYHTKCHLIRYKCMLCGVMRACRATMLDHHNIVHRNGEVQLPCPYCEKTFRRQMSRKRHVQHKHLTKERVECEYCHKTYATKEGLKAHMMALHPKDVSSEIRQYPCEQCGMTFKTPTVLKTHRLTHTLNRDYYCVECDKAFKTEACLKQHLKTTQIHVNVAELPFACDRCEKRFFKQKELVKHINTVHLELKPYKCDQCLKAYTCTSSLREHRRTAHEGYKKPLKYRCMYCDKSFAGGSTLKAHIRTHTGERPYQCDKCPAQFRQSGALATHNKLIHQRLTRDGNPK